MRIFSSYPEALEEIKRDLKEMGIPVRPKTWQDKETDDEHATVELQNYAYAITELDLDTVPCTQPWADAEWRERESGLVGVAANPGHAWALRADDVHNWIDYLELDGEPQQGTDSVSGLETGLHAMQTDAKAQFAYTYSERLAQSVQAISVIDRLRVDPDTRQAYISMWDASIDSRRLGHRRVPCSIGWHFMYRNGALHMTYHMRSCEIAAHFPNDVWLAGKLHQFISDQARMPIGRFQHLIGSLHCYERNVAHVF